MAGLVPAIPLREARCSPKRDARHKAGHDVERLVQTMENGLIRQALPCGDRIEPPLAQHVRGEASVVNTLAKARSRTFKPPV